MLTMNNNEAIKLGINLSISNESMLLHSMRQRFHIKFCLKGIAIQ